jgi:hypothetical protein
MLHQSPNRHLPVTTTISVIVVALFAILLLWLVPTLNRPVTVNPAAVSLVQDMVENMAAHPLSAEAIALREQYEPSYKAPSMVENMAAHPLSAEAIALREQYEPSYAP